MTRIVVSAINRACKLMNILHQGNSSPSPEYRINHLILMLSTLGEVWFRDSDVSYLAIIG